MKKKKIKVVSFDVIDESSRKADLKQFVQELNKEKSDKVKEFEIEDVLGIDKLNLTFDKGDELRFLAIYGETKFKKFDLTGCLKSETLDITELDQDLGKIRDL